jgi:hypothetical protein
MQQYRHGLILAVLIVYIGACSSAQAAIQYNGGNYESGIAATTTSQVNSVINNVVTGQLGASSTTDIAGIERGVQSSYGRLNNWLQVQAGINLKGIVGGIGHFFVVVVGFAVDLFKRLI